MSHESKFEEIEINETHILFKTRTGVTVASYNGKAWDVIKNGITRRKNIKRKNNAYLYAKAIA